MDLEKKIWAASAMLFLTVGMGALGHAAWLVGTVVATLLGGLFLVRDFLPVLNIRPPIVGSYDSIGQTICFFFMTPLWILQKNDPHAHVTLFVLMCAASFFSVLMMFRPLTTNFGVLNALFLYTGLFAIEEFGTGWRTWLTLTLSALMVVLRIIIEERAEVHVVARRE